MTIELPKAEAANPASGTIFYTEIGEADLCHPVAIMKPMVLPNGQPAMVTMAVGGYGKVLGLARKFFHVFLHRRSPTQEEINDRTGELYDKNTQNEPFNGWNVEEACELALAAGKCLYDKATLRQKLTEGIPGDISALDLQKH